MGLDVTLYYYPRGPLDIDQLQNAEEAAQRTWTEFANVVRPETCTDHVEPELTEEEKQARRAACDAVKEAAGLVKVQMGSAGYDWFEYKPVGFRKITMDSTTHPEHLYKIGYFRSSYNSNGLNHVLTDLLGNDSDLYSIFLPNDRYEFFPDWSEAKVRVAEILRRLKEHIENGAPVITEISHNPYEQASFYEAIDTPNAALEIYLREKSQKHAYASYDCKYGSFYLKEPRSVKAFIPGTRRGTDGKFVPAVYAIYEDVEALTWYQEALEVVLETIDYVLAQPDPTHYALHWSS